MQPVEIMPIQDSLVLRARGSELLILAQHISELKQRKSKRDFSMYFTGEALVNRPARKLFEAWLRKDGSLWERLFQMVHEMEQGQAAEDAPKPVVKAETPALTAKSKVVEAKIETGAEKKPAKKSDAATKVKEPAAKASATKATAKTSAKAAPAKKASATKPAKAAAKPAAKATTTKSAKSSSATKSAGKSAAKKR